MTFQENKSLGLLYQEEFQPDKYVSKYYAGLDLGNEFCLRNLHEFFNKRGK